MRSSILIVSIFLSSVVYSQNDWRLYPDQDPAYTVEEYGSRKDSLGASVKEGEVIVHQDARIDSLMSYLDKNPQNIKGYRVEIFFGKRKEAENIKSNFLRKYDQWPIYVVWQQPNFKVQVGNFMTKLQAEKTQQEIKWDYPNAYITITEIKPGE